MAQTHSPTTNLTNSGLISFNSSFEAFIDCKTELLPATDEIACDDKHVVFYIDEQQPRHFRRRFLGATAALRMRRDLCHYLLLTRQFVERGDVAPDVLAMLHVFVPPPERTRVYFDQDSFAHLFSTKTKHRVVGALSLRYDDDAAVGAVCFVRLSSRRHLSVADLYIRQRLKGKPMEFVAVYEGRGWLWVVSP